jgi:hypothetical protein
MEALFLGRQIGCRRRATGSLPSKGRSALRTSRLIVRIRQLRRASSRISRWSSQLSAFIFRQGLTILPSASIVLSGSVAVSWRRKMIESQEETHPHHDAIRCRGYGETVSVTVEN